MGGVAHDLRHAVRRLARSPTFALTALLSLALGIGANAAIFSVVHGVLLSPLPFDDADELVIARETRNDAAQLVSLLSFEGWREADGLSRMAAVRRWPYNVTGGEEPRRVTGLQATAGLLALLGERPARGRELVRSDEAPGAEPVCMVSHAYWSDRLGGRRDLDGLHVVLDGVSHAVVGVLPRGLAIPGFGAPPIVTPARMDPGHPGFGSNHNAVVIGRLADDVSLEAAREELSVIAARLAATYPEWNEGIGVRLVPARDALVQGARRTLWVLFGAVGLVLLIACVNIAGLLLARAMATEGEMAVRVALGARRGRIARLVLSEALVLSVAGGLLGLWVGAAGVELIRLVEPGGIPRLGEVAMNVPVLAFTAVCAVATGMLFGLVPALRASGVSVQATLATSGRPGGRGTRSGAWRILVAAEAAIAVVLLTSGGLLLRSFTNLLQVEPGFASAGRVAMSVSLPESRYADRARVTAFLDALGDRLDAIPGVQTSGASVGLPMQGLVWRKHLTLEGRPAPSLPQVPVVDVSIATPGYLATLGIPVLRGRAIRERDDAVSPYVALVNEAFARTYHPDDDVIGRRLRLAPPDPLLPPDQAGAFPWYTVVGVVADVRRWGLGAQVRPEVFIPQRQDADAAREFFVVVHTESGAAGLANAMREAVWQVDPDQPVDWVRPLDAIVSRSLSQPRFNAALVGSFGLTALILAVMGVYGLVVNTVAARRGEIGIRVALGARPGQVLRHVAGQGLRAALTGIALGVALAMAGTRLMEGMLFGVPTADPVTFLAVPLLMLAAVATASVMPARRATRLDPAEALRRE